MVKPIHFKGVINVKLNTELMLRWYVINENVVNHGSKLNVFLNEDLWLESKNTWGKV